MAISFRAKNKTVSLIKPENTSIARIFSFNFTAISEFYNEFEDVLKRYNFTPDLKLNNNETDLSTFLNTLKIFGDKRQRQVGQIVCAETG